MTTSEQAIRQNTITPSDRTANFTYAIRNLARAADARRRAGGEVLYFNIGDPQVFGFRAPAHVTEVVERSLRDSFNGYTPSSGIPEAREAIAAYATNLGAETNEQDVLVTSGASEAADLVLTALVNEGDEVLVPAPGYPLYTAIIAKLGARALFYKLDENNNWQPSIEEMRALVTDRTRAVVVINPSNPTGAIIPDKTVTAILELARERNLLVIADEVYRELCFDRTPTPASVLALDSGVPLVTLESLSKTHMVPGWRVGWMRFTNTERMKDLIAAVHRLADGRLCSPVTGQYAVRPALEGDRSYIEGFMRELRRRRDFVVERVGAAQGLSCSTPDAAFYIMVEADAAKPREGRTGNGVAADERFVLDLLDATGILVVHASGFGGNPDAGAFRLVYLADTPLLDTALTRIESFAAQRA